MVILIHGQRLTGWSGTWKEYDWKSDDKEVWGRGLYGQIEWAEREDICVSCDPKEQSY